MGSIQYDKRMGHRSYFDSELVTEDLERFVEEQLDGKIEDSIKRIRKTIALLVNQALTGEEIQIWQLSEALELDVDVKSILDENGSVVRKVEDEE